jgi:hypothetical protein
VRSFFRNYKDDSKEFGDKADSGLLIMKEEKSGL